MKLKRKLFASLVLLGSAAGVNAATLFTTVAPLQTTTQIASVTTALAPTAVNESIATFDKAATPMGHPRLLKGAADYAGIAAALKAERAGALKAAGDYLWRNPVSGTSPTLIAQIKSTNSDTRMANWWQQARILEGMAEAATVYYFTKDRWYLAEMRARMQLFGPSILARGCSGDVSETRDFVWFYSLAYDMAFSGMTAQDKQMVKDIVVSCANSGLLASADYLKRYPEHAVSFNAVGKLVGALVILRGELPAANTWLAKNLQTYIDNLSPWGGVDGGYGNGSSYAQWDAGESLLIWDLVERVLAVPLPKKPWLMEFPRFVAYTLPPGTPAGTFGDGAEVKRTEEWARFGKAIMYRSETPLSRWYARQIKGEDQARLHILLSPREYTGTATLPGTQPNGAYFASAGTAAMHSSLADLNRTSVYFKSSPFGSANHSHADQNSFVLYSKGQVLAMDSGSYDYYNSPHWRNYYKQTKAHNAITFDGGIGQPLGSLGLGEHTYSGRLTRFEQTTAWDITTGNATAAYGGMLTDARRTLVFIRPSTLITIDQLASNTARRFEYNLHTSVPLNGPSTAFRADVGAAQMCGMVTAPMALTQTATPGYSPAPTTAIGPHFLNRFAFGTAQKTGLIVSVLRTDCSTAAPKVTFAGTGATITAAGRTVTVTATDVTVK